jgi:ADP-heptose:LPS heptosyltransferase
MAKFPQRLEGWPYKVLIICRRGLSDIIWALPLITAIKSLFPTAKIDWMIDDKYADFISCVKGVDDKVIYPRGDVWPLLKPFKPLFRPLVQALQIVRHRQTARQALPGVFRR